MSGFSETMKRLRYERGMTQEEFANLLGTTKQNISRYEKGIVLPMAATAYKYAEKLGVSLEELNGGPKIDIPRNADEKVQRISEIVNSLSEHQKDLALMYLEMLGKQ